MVQALPLFTTSSDAKHQQRAHLERDAATRAVLDKQAAVDQALVEVLGLETRVDDIAGAGRLLEDANLELAVARVVVGKGAGGALKGLVVLGVVDLEGAASQLAMRRMTGAKEGRPTSCCSRG